MLETYGDLLNSLIKAQIIKVKTCKYWGYENYLRTMSDDFYCDKCGKYHEEEEWEQQILHLLWDREEI